jgi:hypothetical protein
LIPKLDSDSEKILFSIPTPIPKIIFFRLRLRLRKIFFHDSDSNSDSEKFCLRDSDSIGVRCSSLVFGLRYFNIDKWNIHCSIKLYVRDFHGSGRFFQSSDPTATTVLLQNYINLSRISMSTNVTV